MSGGKKTKFAKALRGKSTDSERKLWHYLRAKRFEGIKFRRQEPIGPYVADFVCFEKKVVIECDGGQHAISKGKDAARDQWFRREGFNVLRFWNTDVLKNVDSVLEEIYRALRLD